MFTWIPLYQEIARKVLEFENKQDELLALLHSFAIRGFQIGRVEDLDSQGYVYPLSQIDPFTFFATFNWQSRKPENRLAILAELREEWDLSAPLPEDFDGIPLGNPSQLCFFAFQYIRDSGDIRRLWQFARQIVERTRATVDRELYTRLIGQPSLGEVKLSIGMFWLNPREFLPADKWTRGYMERHGVTSTIWNRDAYFHWLDACIATVGTDFPGLSHAAFLEREAPAVESDSDEDEEGEGEDANAVPGGGAFWVMQAGRGGEEWDNFNATNDIAVGYEGVKDFRTFPDRDAIRARLLELSPGLSGTKDSRKNATLAAWQFCREMKRGDIVFVYGGFHKLLGVARVTGDYRFDADAPSYRHRRKVEWLATGPWTVPEQLRCPSKTLTHSSSLERSRARLALAGVMLDDVGETHVAEPTRPRRYWWLNANPKIWDFRDVAVGQRQTYTAYNENGNKRQKFKYFTEVVPGDLLVGYLTTPDKEIVAICEITKALHAGIGGEAFEFKKIEHIEQPITWAELQMVPRLAECEPVQNNQGSLFALTEEEFDTIRALIDERNPPTPPQERKVFTKADALNGLFMDEGQLDTILARLTRKKGVILQGPPGVGKTFVARRLAYALMGERDDSRVCVVQFHPSYGYEDFIQGYRPDGSGLRLRNGVFYEFARKARHDARPYFFIIDEINRGNLAKIFGELLMLLEADKRGPDYALPLTYAETLDETFWLSENLHVIGTMNTADRSLAMVDYALRRRFAFAPLEPALHCEEFRTWLSGKGAPTALVEHIANRVSKLNEEITAERDLGPGFRIGHSYFCPAVAPPDWGAWYREIIDAEIAPLLEEYFDKPARVRALTDALLA